MNEWSYQEYPYSSQPPPEKEPGPRIMNNIGMRDNRMSSDVVRNFLSDDIGIPVHSPKKKKTGSSDPRFKKIIDSEIRNGTDSAGGKLGSKLKMPSTTSQRNKDQSLNEKALSFPKNPNDSSLFMTPNLKFIFKDRKEQDLSAEVTKDTNFKLPDLLNENIKEFSYSEIQKSIHDESLDVAEKLRSSYNTDLKRSASDCTMQTKIPLRKNESIENIGASPSATRLLNTGNWMGLQKVLPEKRRSVVTVIGQTQTKPFDQILSEIHQRRKLAKELDKHALCEALMSSMENHSKFKNVVAKVDLVLPDGKVIYSTEKIYTRKNNKLEDSIYSQNSMEILDSDCIRKKCEMIPEKESSASQLGKKRLKRLTKKSMSSLSQKTRVKDNLRNIFEDVSPVMFWLVLAIICFGICYSITCFTFQSPQTYYIFKIFKPKTTAWYEKLLFL